MGVEGGRYGYRTILHCFLVAKVPLRLVCCFYIVGACAEKSFASSYYTMSKYLQVQQS